MNFDLNLLRQYTEKTNVCCEKHPDADLYLFGYYKDNGNEKPMIWDDISIHCRGLIVNGKGEVVEHPFPKFWTYRQYLTQNAVLLSEDKTMEIPKGKRRILEKVDGTMVTLYWMGEKPYLATQRSFTNIKALEATKILYEKYSHLFGRLDKRYTYIFEAIYPETKVLIDYGNKRDLVLIGMIDKNHNKILELPDIGFPTCKDYTDLYGHITNFDELAALNLPNQEGFVIYFENDTMMKLKFPWYQEAHKLLDFHFNRDKAFYRKSCELLRVLKKVPLRISTMDIWHALKNGDSELISIKGQVPSYYKLMGFDYWLRQEKEYVINLFNLKKDISFENAKEININYFDINDRMSKPHIYETIVWNWEDRYLKEKLW